MAEKTGWGYSTRRGWTTLDSSTNLAPPVGPGLRTLHEGAIPADKQEAVNENIASARELTDTLLKSLDRNNLEKVDENHIKALGPPFDKSENIDLLKAGDRRLQIEFHQRVDELKELHTILHSGNIELKLVPDSHENPETNTHVRQKGRGGLIGAAYRAMFEKERRARGPEVHGKMKLSDASGYEAEGAIMRALVRSDTGRTQARAIDAVLKFREHERSQEPPAVSKAVEAKQEHGAVPEKYEELPFYSPHDNGGLIGKASDYVGTEKPSSYYGDEKDHHSRTASSEPVLPPSYFADEKGHDRLATSSEPVLPPSYSDLHEKDRSKFVEGHEQAEPGHGQPGHEADAHREARQRMLQKPRPRERVGRA